MKKNNDRPPRKTEAKRPSDKRSLSNDRPQFDRAKPSSRPKTDRPNRDDKPFNGRPKQDFSASDPKRRDDKPFSDRPKRDFGPSNERPKRDFGGSDDRPRRDDKPFSERPKRDFGSSDDRPRRDFGSSDALPKRGFGGSDDRPRRDDKPFSERSKRDFGGSDDRPRRDDKPFSERPKRDSSASDRPKRDEKPTNTTPKRESRPRIGKTKNSKGKSDAGFSLTEKAVYRPHIDEVKKDTDDIRLNKYLADSGIAARRKASEMVLAGEVSINGQVCKEPGYRVKKDDEVKHNNKAVKPVEKMIYLLMNKPKDTITTVSDERGRHTVMEIVGRTVKTRIFPVGRLDRDTTGLLLMTNDGDLAQKMTHPSYRLKKLYQVELHTAVTKHHMEEIAAGLELEDGVAEVDAVNYVEDGAKSDVMIELHIGKNRIVRRIFEHLGYQVVKLDRIYYGGLTKKDLPRGGYRSLTEREVIMLKHFSGK